MKTFLILCFATTVIGCVSDDYYKLTDTINYKRWQRVSKYLYWVYNRRSVEGNNGFNSKTQLGISVYHSIRDSIMAETFFEDYSKKRNVKAIMNIAV